MAFCLLSLWRVKWEMLERLSTNERRRKAGGRQQTYGTDASSWFFKTIFLLLLFCYLLHDSVKYGKIFHTRTFQKFIKIFLFSFHSRGLSARGLHIFHFHQFCITPCCVYNNSHRECYWWLHVAFRHVWDFANVDDFFSLISIVAKFKSDNCWRNYILPDAARGKKYLMRIAPGLYSNFKLTLNRLHSMTIHLRKMWSDFFHFIISACRLLKSVANFFVQGGLSKDLIVFAKY